MKLEYKITKFTKLTPTAEWFPATFGGSKRCLALSLAELRE